MSIKNMTKWYIMLLVLLSAISYGIYMKLLNDKNNFEPLVIVMATSPISYPCELVDSIVAGKKKWQGFKKEPYKNSVVDCAVYIPKAEFHQTYEFCMLSEIHQSDASTTTESTCGYSHPGFFNARIGKIDTKEESNLITCSFTCKIK